MTLSTKKLWCMYEDSIHAINLYDNPLDIPNSKLVAYDGVQELYAALGDIGNTLASKIRLHANGQDYAVLFQADAPNTTSSFMFRELYREILESSHTPLPPNGPTYTFDHTTGTIVQARTYHFENINIPTSFKFNGVNYAVVSLGMFAFMMQGNVKTVTIPETVTTIEMRAFAYTDLSNITLPLALTSLGDYAFYENNISSITWNPNIATVGEGAFGGNALTTLTLPDTIATIGTFSFYNNSLTSVQLSTTMTAIPEGAFGMNSITSVVIPSNITTIAADAFIDNSITSIVIGNDVSLAETSMGVFGSQFYYAYNLGGQVAGTYEYLGDGWYKTA